jgi:hypothetical protein
MFNHPVRIVLVVLTATMLACGSDRSPCSTKGATRCSKDDSPPSHPTGTYLYEVCEGDDFDSKAPPTWDPQVCTSGRDCVCPSGKDCGANTTCQSYYCYCL